MDKLGMRILWALVAGVVMLACAPDGPSLIETEDDCEFEVFGNVDLTYKPGIFYQPIETHSYAKDNTLARVYFDDATDFTEFELPGLITMAEVGTHRLEIIDACSDLVFDGEYVIRSSEGAIKLSPPPGVYFEPITVQVLTSINQITASVIATHLEEGFVNATDDRIELPFQLPAPENTLVGGEYEVVANIYDQRINTESVDSYFASVQGRYEFRLGAAIQSISPADADISAVQVFEITLDRAIKPVTEVVGDFLVESHDGLNFRLLPTVARGTPYQLTTFLLGKDQVGNPVTDPQGLLDTLYQPCACLDWGFDELTPSLGASIAVGNSVVLTIESDYELSSAGTKYELIDLTDGGYKAAALSSVSLAKVGDKYRLSGTANFDFEADHTYKVEVFASGTHELHEESSTDFIFGVDAAVTRAIEFQQYVSDGVIFTAPISLEDTDDLVVPGETVSASYYRSNPFVLDNGSLSIATNGMIDVSDFEGNVVSIATGITQTTPFPLTEYVAIWPTSDTNLALSPWDDGYVFLEIFGPVTDLVIEDAFIRTEVDGDDVELNVLAIGVLANGIEFAVPGDRYLRANESFDIVLKGELVFATGERSAFDVTKSWAKASESETFGFDRRGSPSIKLTRKGTDTTVDEFAIKIHGSADAVTYEIVGAPAAFNIALTETGFGTVWEHSAAVTAALPAGIYTMHMYATTGSVTHTTSQYFAVGGGLEVTGMTVSKATLSSQPAMLGFNAEAGPLYSAGLFTQYDPQGVEFALSWPAGITQVPMAIDYWSPGTHDVIMYGIVSLQQNVSSFVLSQTEVTVEP